MYKTESYNDSINKSHKPETSKQIAPTYMLKSLLNWKNHDSTGHLQYSQLNMEYVTHQLYFTTQMK